MKKETFDFIRELSLKDKKTLSQKALKVSEECGELAKAVLPFDNASGTTHRFIDKRKILQEVVDTMLASVSIAYDLGFSDEDIDAMMYEKSIYWQGLQVREEKIEYPIPYEIHVTIDKDSIRNVDKYVQDCKSISVKPIVLDLEGTDDITIKDVMTSSHFRGDNRGSYEEMKRISDSLTDMGYKVVREKIETVPWHPAAPMTTGDVMPEDCYFEAHIGCIISSEQKEQLQLIASNTDSHLSRNFFKKLEDGKFVNMITYRMYGGVDVTLDMFNNHVEYMKKELKRFDIEFEKVITEFSIYDTKASHDNAWIKKELACTD